MMDTTLGIAIIGAGMMGAVHARAARLAGATVRGIAASSEASAQAAAERIGIPGVYASARQAIEDRAVDVVHICTPNASHYPLALAALEAGKHVVCEKPLATTSQDAATLAGAARKSGLVAAVPFVYRYHPMVREARALVQDGSVGALQLIHGSYLQDWLLGASDTNWRVDAALGGASRAFADIGSHWCDLVEWVSGERFESVVATLQTMVAARPVHAAQTFAAGSDDTLPPSAARQSVSTEDVAGALLRTAGGVLATLTVSQVSAGRKNRLWFEIDGARSSVTFDQEDPERLWIGSRDETRLLVRDPSRGSAEQRRLATLPAGHAQGYAQCFEAFIADTYATIHGQSPEGLPTFDDGWRSARVVDAVLASSQAGRWLPIE
ncbi:Gfo/Idh/MocA family protein [Paraburkholderia sp. MM5482-R1]|uniref:Gfo/Idh/MocA family protein n=1 Tax=unclassified Paraburkholderia TaxID=2615204 RepID=UPI003D1E39F4